MLEANEGPVRVLVCDDDERDLSAVETTLFMSNRVIKVVGTATSATDLLAVVEQHAFDVAVIDLNMPRVDGLQAAAQVKEIAPASKVVIFSSHADRRAEVEASADVDLFVYKVELATLGDRIVELVGMAEPASRGGFFRRLRASA